MSHAPLWATSLSNPKFKRREVLKLLIVACCFILGSVFVLEVQFFSTTVTKLAVGDIASQNIVSPSSQSYISDIATEEAKDQAERLVSDIYSVPDPGVARKQQTVAGRILDLLDAIKTDPYINPIEKVNTIKAIEPVSFSTEEAAAIFELPNTLWLDAKQEVLAVLDEVMRDPIRDSQLVTSRRRLNLLISSDVPEEEAIVIKSIVEDLVQPNTFVDEARTNEERQKAREAVQSVSKTYDKGQIVVREGEPIDKEHIEALEKLGLQESETRWRDIASTLVWITILVILLGLYIIKYHLYLVKDNQQLSLLVIMMLLFIVAIRFAIPSDNSLPYALPMSALTIVIASLIDSHLALVVTIIMGMISMFVRDGSIEQLTYVLMSGFVVVLVVSKMSQLNNLLWAGLYATLSNIAVILVFRFFENDLDFIDLLTRLGGGLLGGVLTTFLPLVVFIVVGNLTRMVTYMQLLELSKPTHPLLSELLRRAPGTYHHSLLVSNLAEQAAERIGANAFLCRIGAYYHDVGKMTRPYFFTENTPSDGNNLHDSLNSETSAQIIISHVTDGLDLAKKYRLPVILCSFIAEHHGTEVVGYFYHQAIKAANGDESQVDKSKFTYPGPAPQSKETAILMLADASEATVRSVQPRSSTEIDEIVRRTIANRMKSGQFDECDLTMRDLEQIRIAFNDVLQGVSHPRVKYPDQVKKEDTVDTGPLPPLPLAMQRTSISNTKQEYSPTTKNKYPIPRD